METHIIGTLYLVATPIGNLSDITFRAVETLKSVDFIAAEDTRVTRKLLNHFGFKKTLVSYYEHNQKESGDKIVDRIGHGENCALVTDAGTPAISDPGEDLVRKCLEKNINIVTIPGPCAAICALTVSGLSSAKFTFEGFLSSTKKKRITELCKLKEEKRTMIFYEAPHRISQTLEDMLSVLGDRNVSISREITKLYEQTIRMKLSAAIKLFNDKKPRGEFVVIVEGDSNTFIDKEERFANAVKSANNYIKSGLSLKDSVKRAAKEFDCSKNELYKILIK